MGDQDITCKVLIMVFLQTPFAEHKLNRTLYRNGQSVCFMLTICLHDNKIAYADPEKRPELKQQRVIIPYFSIDF